MQSSQLHHHPPQQQPKQDIIYVDNSSSLFSPRLKIGDFLTQPHPSKNISPIQIHDIPNNRT